uniref:Uncharacterized protein n=1 Tax=Arundo donax TaxID=35708 RepID=A0A0A9BM22_ARUDO
MLITGYIPGSELVI